MSLGLWTGLWTRFWTWFWTGQHYVWTNVVFQNFPGLQFLIASSLVPKVRITQILQHIYGSFYGSVIELEAKYHIAGHFRGWKSSIRSPELNFVVLNFVAWWAVIGLWTLTFEHECDRCCASAAGHVWERLQRPWRYLGGYTIESTREQRLCWSVYCGCCLP